MGRHPAGLTTNGRAGSGWPLWGYPVLALVIMSIMSAAIFDLVSPSIFGADRVLEASIPVPAAEPDSEGQGATSPVTAPLSIDIPDLGLSAAVDPVGLNPDRTLEVPKDFSRTGWYTGLAAPGMQGTAVIVGHFDSRSGPAVFHRLSELSAGNEIVVKLADGRNAEFVVERTAQYQKDRFPTLEVYGPSSGGLRLITCGGVFDRRSRHYQDNVVVYASTKVAGV